VTYCHLQTGTLLRLFAGERVPEALTDFARREGWTSGWLQGIGGVEAVELAYFDRSTREYQRKKFEGVFELITCAGNLAMVENEPFWHLHALIGDANYQLVGGHLVGLTIAVTGEFWLTRGEGLVQRTIDEPTGLKLLDLDSHLR